MRLASGGYTRAAGAAMAAHEPWIHERWIGNVITIDSQSRDGTKTMIWVIQMYIR